MSVKIRITAGGIFGADGEIEIGSEHTLAEEPTGWAGRYIVISRDDEEGQTAVTNPAKPAYEAKHKGGGSYSIFDADGNEVAEKLTKTDAELFNDASDEDKTAFIAAHNKPAE